MAKAVRLFHVMEQLPLACLFDGLCKGGSVMTMAVRCTKNIAKITSFYATYLRRGDKIEKNDV
jgi:hypothetical protein